MINKKEIGVSGPKSKLGILEFWGQHTKTPWF